MLQRFALAGVASVCAVTATQAHDFWLQPKSFAVAPGEPLDVAFMIGHAGAHEPWNLRLEKVAALQMCASTGGCRPESDIVPDTAEERGRARVSIAEAGAHFIAFESRPSFSELDGAKFTDYAKKEGLTAILDDRAARGAGDRPGRELYSRRAKTLIRVGGDSGGDVSRPVGHTLEIVPVENPYRLKRGDALSLRVLFNGAPLIGATIDFDDLSDDLDPLQTALTDADGAASFRVEGQGPFKIMTIWGVPLEDRRRADFETIFASLTFGS